MHTFKNTAAQGDVFIRRVDTIPTDAAERRPTDNRHIVAHSETGHHHWLEAGQVRFPKEWLEPGGLSVDVALTHENLERRRVAAEMIGWETILSELDTTARDEER